MGRKKAVDWLGAVGRRRVLSMVEEERRKEDYLSGSYESGLRSHACDRCTEAFLKFDIKTYNARHIAAGKVTRFQAVTLVLELTPEATIDHSCLSLRCET